MRRLPLLLLALFCTLSRPVPAEDSPKILFLLAQGFNRTEFYQLYLPLRALGLTVDIAAPQAGRVTLDPEGLPDPQGRDAWANLALSDLTNTTDYAALVIPGGYSPGILEQHPHSLLVCSNMLNAGQPVYALCHGPRLLLRAGLLHDRVFTCLHTVASECAEAWTANQGVYLDQSPVRDRNLVTGRYPNDTPGLFQSLREELAAKHPSVRPLGQGSVFLAFPPGFPPHRVWLLSDPLRLLGYDVQTAPGKELPDAVIGFGAATAPAAFAHLPTLLLGPGEEAGQDVALLPRMHEFLRLNTAPRALAPPTTPFASVLALSPGFDDMAAAVLLTHLRQFAGPVAVVGPEKGWMRGAAGLAMDVQWTYDEVPPLSAGAWVVAPGFLWPHLPGSRQAEPSEVLNEAIQAQVQRVDWLLAAHKNRHRLIAVGFDAWNLGRQPVFKGRKIAAPEQTRWSFGKEGGEYVEVPARESAPRFFTAAGVDALPALLEQLLSPP